MNFSQHDRMIVGEVEFYIILVKVQNSFCIIAFCDKVFCQRLHPVANEVTFFAIVQFTTRIR